MSLPPTVKFMLKICSFILLIESSHSPRVDGDDSLDVFSEDGDTGESAQVQVRFSPHCRL